MYAFAFDQFAGDDHNEVLVRGSVLPAYRSSIRGGSRGRETVPINGKMCRIKPAFLHAHAAEERAIPLAHIQAARGAPQQRGHNTQSSLNPKPIPKTR